MSATVPMIVAAVLALVALVYGARWLWRQTKIVSDRECREFVRRVQGRGR